MGKQFHCIEPTHREFIERQHIFFNASAAPEGRVNVSPRDRAALRILDPNTVIYLDRTGSGNETAAHLLLNDRLTMMFCAFEGSPMILRLYGHARIIPRHRPEYDTLLAAHFDNTEFPGARQMRARGRSRRCGNSPVGPIRSRRPRPARSSTTSSSATNSTAGPKSKAKPLSKTTGAKRTPTASTATPRACLKRSKKPPFLKTCATTRTPKRSPQMR